MMERVYGRGREGEKRGEVGGRGLERSEPLTPRSPGGHEDLALGETPRKPRSWPPRQQLAPHCSWHQEQDARRCVPVVLPPTFRIGK